VEDPHQYARKDKTKGKSKETTTPVLEQITLHISKVPLEEDQLTEDSGDIDMQLDDRELAKIDMEKLEEAYHKHELQSLPLEQLRKVQKVYLNSTTGET
jgi:hypothetical protein